MDPLLILIFIILFMLSGFFSGTEIALMSLAPHKIDSLVKKKKFGAKTLKQIKEQNDRLLIAILIWNNLVNVYTAALATQIAISFAKSVSLPEAEAVWIATWIITFLLLLFGEIIPKSFATKNAVKISLFVAPIYKFLIIVLFPIILFIDIIIKIFAWEKNIETMSEDEIESFIDMWAEKWWIDKEEYEKIKSVLELDNTTVEEIMTPRVKIEALDINSTLKEAFSFYMSHTHSRIPIFIDTIDNIEYFLTPRDILREIEDWNKNKTLKKLNLKKVLKVPLNQSVSRLFEILRKSRKILAIVMDEYGWVAGLVTTEDIVEEVFWEIRDETDRETDFIKQISASSFMVESEILIEELLKKFDLKLENVWLDEKEFDWETLGYLITNIVWDFPNKNQIIKLKIKAEKKKNKNKSKNKKDKSKFLQFKILEIENAKIWKIEAWIVEEE